MGSYYWLGQADECVGRDAIDISRLVGVHASAFRKTIHHILPRLVHLGLGLGGSPEEDVTVFCPDGFELAHLAWSLTVNPRHEGL